MGVGDVDTVMLSDEAKANPLESHARITMACLPAAREITAVSVALVLLAFWTESMYMIIAVTGCSASRAAAENVTGEVTVAPASGEQIFTVLSTVDVQLCDEARSAPTNTKSKNRVPTERVLNDMPHIPFNRICRARNRPNTNGGRRLRASVPEYA